MVTSRYGWAIPLIVLCISVLGCRSRSRDCLPNELLRSSPLLPQCVLGDPAPPLEPDMLESLATRLQQASVPAAQPAKKTRVLVLSGGGMYGAYTVGVLSGWTTTGTRPCFDVVTGISTGGLIATYAFLGPQYDDHLAELFTNVTNRDIYRLRGPTAVIRSDAAASSKPLKDLIEEQISDEILQQVAKAHRSGRRLYVATTNIDTRRLVIWDMGGIASSGRPDAKALYCNVLLASSSIPGLLPPVKFDITVDGQRYTELHVDGGAVTGLFLRPSMLPINAESLRGGERPLEGSDAYVIVAGKLYSDAVCTEPRGLKVASGAVDSLLFSQTREAVNRIYTLCALTGMRFHLAALPEEFEGGSDRRGFDRESMRKLFAAGYAQASGGSLWLNAPVPLPPNDEAVPRTGTQFTTR